MRARVSRYKKADTSRWASREDTVLPASWGWDGLVEWDEPPFKTECVSHLSVGAPRVDGWLPPCPEYSGLGREGECCGPRWNDGVEMVVDCRGNQEEGKTIWNLSVRSPSSFIQHRERSANLYFCSRSNVAQLAHIKGAESFNWGGGRREKKRKKGKQLIYERRKKSRNFGGTQYRLCRVVEIGARW